MICFHPFNLILDLQQITLIYRVVAVKHSDTERCLVWTEPACKPTVEDPEIRCIVEIEPERENQ